MIRPGRYVTGFTGKNGTVGSITEKAINLKMSKDFKLDRMTSEIFKEFMSEISELIREIHTSGDQESLTKLLSQAMIWKDYTEKHYLKCNFEILLFLKNVNALKIYNKYILQNITGYSNFDVIPGKVIRQTIPF